MIIRPYIGNMEFCYTLYYKGCIVSKGDSIHQALICSRYVLGGYQRHDNGLL